ncbi:MAG: chromosome segregation protein SMC [Blastocatellia bacterium]
MLRIEKIQVQGFKSFCDPTEIVFDQVGITAVVGPNGCGKSNVADALSWVIGEQRARALRGGKMEDVIFQGSRNRQPAGMAEVLLTLLVQEDFEITEKQADGHPEPESAQPFQSPAGPKKKVSFQSGDRIVIGRRLYRTGESEYEMNGRVCRLRDIQELFIGTGLSGAHYAIIEQGRVGQILSAKPLERRALIEEAAGISKFRMQQHAAELKLEASRQNLARITDILSEVERQHNSLKRQASKARRYQRLRDEMRQLMRSLYAYDYQDTEQRINRLQAQISSLARTESHEQSRLEAVEELHQEAIQINNRITEQANAAKEKISQITLEAERLQQQKFYLQEQLQELSRRAEDQTREEQTAIQRKELTEQEISRLRLDLKQLEEEINSSGKLLSSEENEHLTLQEKDSAAQAGLKELRQAIYESATQLERWRQLRRQFADAVERHQQKLDGAGLEKERASMQLSGIQEQIASLTVRLNEVQEEHQETIRQIRSTDESLHNLSAERDSAQERYRSLQRDLTSSGSRLDSLLELDQKKSAFTEAVQEILRLNSEHTSDNQTGHPLGTLADFIHTSPEYEVMLEAALRDELQYILVPDLHQALTFLDYLNREKPGRASFLATKPPEEEQPEEEEEEKENRRESLSDAISGSRDSSDLRLIEILGLDSGVRAVFERVFPQLAAARIVKDTAEAIALSRHDRDNIYITATGERVIQGAFLTGGSSAERRLGILTIKREITELQAVITELKIRTEQAESELTTLTSRIHSLNTERQVLDTRIRQAEQTIPILREQLQQSRREQERTETWLSVISRETLQEELELREAQQKLEQASQAAEAESERHLALETEIEEAQTRAAQLRQETEARIARLSGRRAEIATRTERRRSLLNELHRLEEESHSISRRLALQQTDAAQAADKASEIRNSLHTIEESLTVKEQEHSLSLKQLEEVTARLQTERQRAEEQEQEIRALRASLLSLRDEKSTLKIELASNSAQITHLAERCRNDLGEEITSLTNPTFHNQERSSAGRYQTLVEEIDDSETEADVFDEHGEMEASALWSSQIPESADQSAFDPDQARARLADLRDKLDKLGPVNLVALNEIAETSERIRFLNEQKADIEKAVLDTQAAFSEIRRRSKERFREAFQNINANFTGTFQELFGGGQGEMRLIDENDPLESGIEIIAQPPGKRLQNVLLLSGGEKAMTAIALVMAIFKYRPSPFCLLDEVDAPLDEINIGRFADKILEMSQQTQFMVITHSKRTMEAAGTLYGVTMEDPGISRLVSVRLS